VKLFGWWLTEVTDVAFTLGNCSTETTTFNNIHVSSFEVQIERRISLITSFPHAEEDYKICLRMKQKKDNNVHNDIELTPYWMVSKTFERTFMNMAK
jgi:hypothetical protein